jgi:hypothetical protein
MNAAIECPDEWPFVDHRAAAKADADPDEALKKIRAARRQRGDSPSLAAEAGACYEAKGEVGLARREYARAAALDPGLSSLQSRIDALDQIEEVARSIAAAILAESSPAR